MEVKPRVVTRKLGRPKKTPEEAEAARVKRLAYVKAYYEANKDRYYECAQVRRERKKAAAAANAQPRT